MWRCWDESLRPKMVRSLLDGELRFYTDWDRATGKKMPPKPGIVAAWNGDSFGLRANGAEFIAALETIFDALKRKDAAVWCGGGGVFKNAGLMIGIISLLPADGLETMRAADEDRAKLKATAKETGIAKRLEGKRQWFALSPRWRNEDEKTAYPVVFWLNPQEQSIYNAGRFTVEELDEWAHGRGPVMRASK